MKPITITKRTTGWFDPTTPPTYIGVYERQYEDSPGLTHYSFWDGSFWYESRSTPEQALMAINWSLHQKERFQWRGLAEMPVYRPFENPLRSLSKGNVR